MNKRLYGFYSKQADSDGRCAINVYRTADGREVTVTGVATSEQGAAYAWPDKVALGEVVEHVRTVRKQRPIFGEG